MRFSSNDIEVLRNSIGRKLSGKRFAHTISVMDTALVLADYFVPDMKDIVSVSALLHDVTKELAYDEHIELMRFFGYALQEDDIPDDGVIHALTAPLAVKRDFSQFAVDEVLSAVCNHTTGSPDMTLIDEIIFLSDFIEETRNYESCKVLRSQVLGGLKPGAHEENLRILHKACIFELDSTISHLISKKKKINLKSVLTRNALLSKI